MKNSVMVKTKKKAKVVKKKRAGGRPTKYRTAFCKKLVDFFNIEATREVILPHYKDGKLAWKDKKVMANTLPTIERFCASIEIHKDTLHEWVKRHKAFSDAYARAKLLQAAIWQENSMLGLYNPQFAIFFGKNCMGWKDKNEVVMTDDRLSEVECENLRNILAERQK